MCDFHALKVTDRATCTRLLDVGSYKVGCIEDLSTAVGAAKVSISWGGAEGAERAEGGENGRAGHVGGEVAKILID